MTELGLTLNEAKTSRRMPAGNALTSLVTGSARTGNYCSSFSHVRKRIASQPANSRNASVHPLVIKSLQQTLQLTSQNLCNRKTLTLVYLCKVLVRHGCKLMCIYPHTITQQEG